MAASGRKVRSRPVPTTFGATDDYRLSLRAARCAAPGCPPCYSCCMRETGWHSPVVCSVLRRMAPLALGGWMVIAGCSDGEEGGQDGGGNAPGSGGTPGSGGIGG